MEKAGQSAVMTMTLRQDGVRVTGTMSAALAGETTLNQPINATIKGNRLVADASDGKSGGTTIGPDYNTLTLDMPDGQIVFKRVN